MKSTPKKPYLLIDVFLSGGMIIIFIWFYRPNKALDFHFHESWVAAISDKKKAF